MDPEIKWYLILLIVITIFIGTAGITNNYWDHQLAMEAIKAGLVQDGNSHWIKPPQTNTEAIK